MMCFTEHCWKWVKWILGFEGVGRGPRNNVVFPKEIKLWIVLMIPSLFLGRNQ